MQDYSHVEQGVNSYIRKLPIWHFNEIPICMYVCIVGYLREINTWNVAGDKKKTGCKPEKQK